MLHHLVRKNQEYWNHERSLIALLTYMCLAVLCWISLGDYSTSWWAFGIGDILFNLIILAGVFAVFTEWRRQFTFILIAMFAGIFQIVSFFIGSTLWLVLSYSFSILFLILLAKQVIKRIFKDGPMNFYRIQGSIIIFLIIGVVYAMLYAVLEAIHPGSLAVAGAPEENSSGFSQVLYFSFVTMTTMGIGDMIPVSPFAKSLVVFQGIVGLLYPVIMIARLVSLEVTHSAHLKRQGGSNTS